MCRNETHTPKLIYDFKRIDKDKVYGKICRLAMPAYEPRINYVLKILKPYNFFMSFKFETASCPQKNVNGNYRPLSVFGLHLLYIFKTFMIIFSVVVTVILSVHF